MILLGVYLAVNGLEESSIIVTRSVFERCLPHLSRRWVVQHIVHMPMLSSRLSTLALQEMQHLLAAM